MADRVPTAGSLRTRLAATLIGGAAALAVILYFIARLYAAQIAQQGQDNVLGASVTSILDAAALRDGVVEVDLPYAAFSMLRTPADDRVFYAIFQDDELLSGYENLRPGVPRPGEITFGSGTVGQTNVRVATGVRQLIGGAQRTDITVAVAQTQDSLAGVLSTIARNVALFGGGFFVLAVLLSFWATSATIGPLRRLAISLARRGPQDLSPVSRPVPAEMVPLVSSLNSLMGRLDQALHQSEDFIAEAAHRVRTPLATVRSYAETTLQRVDKEENRQALRAMMRAVDESSRAAGQLLDHAMTTFRADHLDRQPVDLVALVQELVRSLTPLADMKDIALRVHATGAVPYDGDAILLQNAVRNLVDNALKYAPTESSIDISVTADPQPTVEVRDEGPGFPAEDMAALPGRFTRGPNAKGIIGSGLGLTIAQDVATAHGGRLILNNQKSGGACVSLVF